jgi:hypothetical protein
VPIYGVWVQDDDVTGGSFLVNHYPATTGFAWPSDALPAPPGHPWADVFTTDTATPGGPTALHAADTTGVGINAYCTGWFADSTGGVVAEASGQDTIVDVQPGYVIPPDGYSGGPTGTPPAGAIDWEYDPDDTDELTTLDITITLAAGSNIDATAYLCRYGDYTETRPPWEVTEIVFPGRSGWLAGETLLSMAVTGNNTLLTGEADTFDELTLTGLVPSDLQSLALTVGLDYLASDTEPVGNPPAPPSDQRCYFYIGAGLTDPAATFRPRRWRWIYEPVATPPLLARAAARADAGGIPPLLARGRNTRQERLTARGPL